jgi:hypothetical protein
MLKEGEAEGDTDIVNGCRYCEAIKPVYSTFAYLIKSTGATESQSLKTADVQLP